MTLPNFNVLHPFVISHKKGYFDTFSVYFKVRKLETKIVQHKGRCQKRFSGFCPLRGYQPPPTPLTENRFAKKPLAERGGPPPPLTESPLSFFEHTDCPTPQFR